MIEIKRKGDIAIIEIDNPPMNAVCKKMLGEMEKKLKELSEEDGLRAAILTGNGEIFVAGADIKEMKDMDPKEARKFSRRGQKLFHDLSDLPFAVISAVNGYALGGGLELALSTDIVIASKGTKFGQPEVGLGIIPGFGGTVLLQRAIGESKAKELIFTGKKIKAEKAEELGIVDKLVEEEELMEEAEAFVKKITSNSPVAIKNAKKVMNKTGHLPKREALKKEAEFFEKCFESEDQKEGMEAFLEKRDPEF